MSTLLADAPVVKVSRPHAEWFRHARFGMFVHWGLYSVLGRHEWGMNNERIPVAEYEQLARQWHPTPDCARRWARMAKQAGARYMVLTTKHHEGFCLFDSRHTSYNAVKQSHGRDMVREYVEACRSEGLKVGLYYSLMDWHHPDGIRCAHDEQARQRFVRYTHGLVEELMTNYGQIDLLWYDVSWPLTPEAWESVALNRMVRRLQPGIIINDRAGIEEDFATPEQHITAPANGRMWEACMTFSEESWGYTPLDTRFKDANQVLRMLAKVANGEGNLLLNISPRGDGSLPVEIERALTQVGAWLDRNGQVIYDASDAMKPDHTLFGTFTRKGNTAYFLVDHWGGKSIAVGGLTPAVKQVDFLDGQPIKFTYQGDRLVLHGLPELAPDPLCTVIAVQCDGPPHYDHGPGPVILDHAEPWRKYTPAGFSPVMENGSL